VVEMNKYEREKKRRIESGFWMYAIRPWGEKEKEENAAPSMLLLLLLLCMIRKVRYLKA